MAGTSFGMDNHNFTGIRCAGSRGQRGGKGEGMVFGGIYYPKHKKADGSIVSARWEASFYVNHMGYTDRTTGQKQKGRSDIIRVVAWNGKDAQPGRGLADLMAKAITPGKELSGVLDMRTYSRKIYLKNGQMVVEADGTPLEISGMVKFYINRGQFLFGADSEKMISAEIADGMRPPEWNQPSHPNYLTWQQMVTERNAEVWQGRPSYGYAQVIIPPAAVELEHALINEPIVPRKVFASTTYGAGSNSNTGFNGTNNQDQNNNFGQNNGQQTGQNNGFTPTGQNNNAGQNGNFGVTNQQNTGFNGNQNTGFNNAGNGFNNQQNNAGGNPF